MNALCVCTYILQFSIVIGIYFNKFLFDFNFRKSSIVFFQEKSANIFE
jgi:hypothetical protein